MPELPEVETVCRGLKEIVPPNQHSIVDLKLGKFGLREPFRKKDLVKAKGQKIKNIIRKAKYLLFELDSSYLISHLGMTGSWRIEGQKETHDHVRIFLEDGRVLTYRDPRRFGQFDIISKDGLDTDKRFIHLGPDPVMDKSFDGNYLFAKTRSKNTPIKNLIMNQEVVVGVGNIYASEALYLAGILPHRLSYTLKQKDCNRLVEAIKETLKEAILCGGSTISDFKQAGGSEGYFQNLFFVYDKDGDKCGYCNKPIEKIVLAGRSSYYCLKCQK